MYVDDILFGGTTEFENCVQRAQCGLKLRTIKRQNFDFLGISVATYNDPIEVKPVLRDVTTIQEFGHKPAADNEMALGDGMLVMARSLISKLQ